MSFNDGSDIRRRIARDHRQITVMGWISFVIFVVFHLVVIAAGVAAIIKYLL